MMPPNVYMKDPVDHSALINLATHKRLAKKLRIVLRRLATDDPIQSQFQDSIP